MATKKKTTTKRPSVPTVNITQPTEAPAPQYQPMSVADFNKFMEASYGIQLKYAPQVTEAQRYAQEVLFRSMSALQREQAPAFASTASQLASSYAPTFLQQYEQQRQNLTAALADVVRQRGDVDVLEDVATRELGYGYELGPDLGREVEQAVRGAQTARGNILGAAPTAQEAFGKGQAALNLFQQRLGNYNQYLGQRAGVTGSQLQATGAVQNYLQGRNPVDIMSQMAGSFMGQSYYPSQSYVDTSLGANAAIQAGAQGQQYNATVMSGYSSFQNALQNYNQNQINSTFGTYDRRAESWMYDEAVRRGLYSTPSVGGSSSGMGGLSGVLSGVGGGIASGIGIAAAGGGATAAIGGGAAAAISAAGAAICWLARRVIPDRWEEWQRYLFTDAPEKLRRLYLYNARRLAREITDDEAAKIGGLMYDCLNLRSLA